MHSSFTSLVDTDTPQYFNVPSLSSFDSSENNPELQSQSTEYDYADSDARCDFINIYLDTVKWIEQASMECLKTSQLDLNLIVTSCMNCASNIHLLLPREDNFLRKQALEQLSLTLENQITILLEQKARLERQIDSSIKNDFVLPSAETQSLHLLSNNNNNMDKKYQIAIEATIMVHSPELTLDKVSGYENAKNILKEALIFPRLFKHMLPIKSHNILLYGPPGTGKTQLAKAVVNEFQATCFAISSADILSSWVGESEKYIKNLINFASKQENLSIILIDEVDSLCRMRKSNEDDYIRRIKTELMQQMDVATNRTTHFSVLGITNCPWELDKAFLRRFDKRIYISLPNLDTKVQILHDKLSLIPHLHSISIEELRKFVENLINFSCFDVVSIFEEATLNPFRELQTTKHWHFDLEEGKWHPLSAETTTSIAKSFYEIEPESIRIRKVIIEDFVKSLASVHGTISTEDIRNFDDFTKLYGTIG